MDTRTQERTLVWTVAPEQAEPDEVMTRFTAWIGRNVALRKRAPSPETLRGYLGEAKHFLDWLNGAELAAVTPQVVRDYADYLRDDGHGLDAGGSRRPRDAQGRYSPATIQKKVSVLKTFFRFTTGEGLTMANPLAGEALRLPEANEHRVEHVKALTQEQAVRLLRMVNADVRRRTHPDRLNAAVRDKVIISLMMLQGLRTVEVERLDVGDYTANVWGGQGTLKVHGKGDKTRTVVLRPEMQVVLDDWMKRRALYHPETEAVFVSLHTSESELSGARLQRMSRRAIRERVDVYLERAGLKGAGISCHALRHTYATEIVAAARRSGSPVDREGLARSMGHSDVRITETYIDYVDMFLNNPATPLMAILAAADDDAQ